MKILLWIFLCAIVALTFVAWIGIKSETKAFNKGVCKKCGRKLKYFDVDTQGGRGYKCEACDYYTWVSYLCVDKDYWEGKEWRSDIL